MAAKKYEVSISDPVTIRILEKDANRYGDLFGKLMADLLVALGYEQPRLNIHKSGREIDLSANHRLEPRRAIGECKATGNPIGGDDLNKFVGVLDVEHDDKRPLAGYFISLSGFKETAIEQEKQRQRTKIITLDGVQVVSELVKGRILIPKEKATELAGRCCANQNSLTLDPEVELLAHQRGWIWAIYYTQGKARTHFVLIHSDGTLLVRALANEVVATDQDCGGRMEKLVCLNPEPLFGLDTDPQVAQALEAYGQYLTTECGFIHLDGLPADGDVGSRRLRLENLFVPLHLDITARVGGEQKKMERQPVGAVLSDYPRLALLAAPGGGKSTLIKRLVVAYADLKRRELIDDKLPSRDWIPLFFRCRELRGLSRGSFCELIDALSQREPVRQYAKVFRGYIDRALLAGRVLLLVDGLDEISDPSDRAAFVCTIRTALQAYPSIATIITSREAGFRHVAAHIAPICTHAVVSTFNQNDIRRLSVAWHREVVGDTEKVCKDAELLAKTIIHNDRIKRLAMNPLLLTTLLLVKRWVGSLPTRRAVLYGKAVEVLLMTWNVEGHEPIPEEEAMPQLCYIASGMMQSGLQKISRPRLAKLLQEAREALPTELGYVKNSVDQFIHRIEDRSSLLMMTGLDVEDGLLVEFFEFRHLTFQEFLTARAMVNKWNPGRKDSETLVNVLEPHFLKEEWREVIPLSAVLGGKETEALIQRLTESNKKIDPNQNQNPNLLYSALVNCLADEAAARPETVRSAVNEIVRFGSDLHREPAAEMLTCGKYGSELRNEARNAFFSGMQDIGNAGDALLIAVRFQTLKINDYSDISQAADHFVEMLKSDQLYTQCEGALGIADIFGNYSPDQPIKVENPFRNSLVNAGPILLKMLDIESDPVTVSAVFALEKLGFSQIWSPPDISALLERLFKLWRQNTNITVKQLAARAIVAQPLAFQDKNCMRDSFTIAEIAKLISAYKELDGWLDKPAALIIALYTHAIDEEVIRNYAKELLESKPEPGTHSILGYTLNKIIERLSANLNVPSISK